MTTLLTILPILTMFFNLITVYYLLRISKLRRGIRPATEPATNLNIEPRFYCNQQVFVRSGFYRGSHWYVAQIRTKAGRYQYRLLALIDKWFDEDDLRPAYGYDEPRTVVLN